VEHGEGESRAMQRPAMLGRGTEGISASQLCVCGECCLVPSLHPPAPNSLAGGHAAGANSSALRSCQRIAARCVGSPPASLPSSAALTDGDDDAARDVVWSQPA
jgi:hypothetical protein